MNLTNFVNFKIELFLKFIEEKTGLFLNPHYESRPSPLLVVGGEVKPNFVVIVTDAFDGRILENRNYEKIVNLKNIKKLQNLGTTFSRKDFQIFI